MNTQVT